jgi:TraY domain
MVAKQSAPAPGKRIMLGLRVAPDVKQRLDAAAMKNGRSQSQEAELRLKESLRDDDLIERITSPQVRPVLDYFTALRTLKIDITPEVVDAVCEGAVLIIKAVGAGGMSDERVKQFWLEDIVRHKGRAADALVAAFNVLTFARLAPRFDPTQWFRGGDNAR